MNFKKALGLGLLLWIIMFAVASAFVAFKFSNSLMTWAIIIVEAVVALLLAGWAKPATAGKALGYGLTWVVVGLILDYLITKHFAPGVFSTWGYWVAYLLVLIMPTFKVKKGVTM